MIMNSIFEHMERQLQHRRAFYMNVTIHVVYYKSRCGCLYNVGFATLPIIAVNI